MESRLSIIFERINFPDIFDKIRGFKKIGIQLPDGLKYYAKEISDIFEDKGFEVIFSGKASYGACDIDLELLKNVEILLHFGHTKLLDYRRIIYIPYKVNYEVKVETIKRNVGERNIAIIGTANYAWKFKEVAEILKKAGYNIELRKGKNMEYEGQILGCNYSCLKNLKSDAVLFIGDGKFHAIGASIYVNKKVYAYNPLTDEIETVNSEDFLKRRYFVISKAKLCDSFGILVSTKIGQKRLGLALNLKELAKKRGKKAEIVLTDEISKELLENFNFECYVNTACPRITYDDYKRYGKILISPQEFEMALGFKTDFELDII